MKVNSLPFNYHTCVQKHFFPFRIVLVSGGLIIFFLNCAHGEWTQEDPLLKKSPKEQGWRQVEDRRPPLIQKFDKKS